MADAGLARLSGHARRLGRLQRILESATPLARQSRIANIKSGRILIYAANNAVAAKLRQIEPRLIKAFQNELAEVTGIETRVQPAGEIRRPPRTDRPLAIGDQSKRSLTSLADSLPEDSALRAAIRRLVERS